MSPDVDHKNRKLTNFLCQELLYDYATDNLDPRRKEDVEEFLKSSRESQREYEMLKRGLKASQLVSRLQVSEDLREALLNFEPQWRKSMREWTLWSSQRGWKILPYAFVGATLVLVILVKKPWRDTGSKDLILAEQTKASMADKPTAIPPAAEATVAAVVPAETAVPAPAPAPAPTTVAAQAPPAKAPAPVEDLADRRESSPAPVRGFLMRGEIDVSDFNNTWPLIRDKIIALGGKAAGSVELGWLRKADESYFHFTVPESSYNELELFLGTFGQVRFSKERHPRVMPEGQIRIILTVKDGPHTNESPTETP